MSEPIRTCVGCRRRDARATLVRHVLVDGALVRDPGATLPGRGAWLHDDEECLRAAVRRGGFARSFRRRVDATVLLSED